MATSNPKRGEVWLVDLDPTRGQEIKKNRPVVVLSADPIGSTGQRIIIPLTGYKLSHDKYPWCVPLTKNSRNGLSKDSTADAFQIKCVSMDLIYITINWVAPIIPARLATDFRAPLANRYPRRPSKAHENV